MPLSLYTPLPSTLLAQSSYSTSTYRLNLNAETLYIGKHRILEMMPEKLGNIYYMLKKNSEENAYKLQ